MAGLVPAILVLLGSRVDARVKPGHDESRREIPDAR
jgi:hypothetical protein